MRTRWRLEACGGSRCPGRCRPLSWPSGHLDGPHLTLRRQPLDDQVDLVGRRHIEALVAATDR